MSWSWPLFAWGVGVGVVGVAGSYVVGRIARLGYDQRQAYAGLAVMSLVVASVAAALPSTTVDVVFTLFVAIANFVLPLVLLHGRAKPASHACDAGGGACGAEACATCPFGAPAGR